MKEILVISIALMALFAVEADAEGKLKIGIKKRVENCSMKTKKGDLVHMHYTGTLEDGTVFDSSLDRGQHFTFTLGSGQVIKGWDQGLLGMCEGEKRRLVIPPELGYGKRAMGDKIPASSTLIFEVELHKIERKQEL
ncbi:peptidyl-prolyl cis-trans isomerase FKBP2 [Phlebotomus argentipes]|uniref:peptidyl-prolyl cis-trans isomerase FKBP2 n=1 Tax=Phlebotomus argentipes TaxID=94469 RepID=UPI002893260B|nr:peptidyl-prolyl cis-trans isomerase FKBP2 [Phlebotomus argentipes]